MIVTRQKPFDEILKSLEGYERIYLIGCSLCSTVCKTGGEDEVKAAAEELKKNGKEVVGYEVLDPSCNLLGIKRFYRENKDVIDSADIILSFACGGGVQAVSEIILDKEIVPGNDTLFQGETTKVTLKEAVFDQKCSLCGECMLSETGGICPVTRCPKGLVNGPCGGVKNGKCEVNSDLDCAWILIYERMKKFDRIDDLKKVRISKDHQKDKKPQRHTL